MRSWFFAKDGQQHGPVTEDDLSDMLATGALSTDALVWTQEMKEWRPAKKVESLIHRDPPPHSLPIDEPDYAGPTTEECRSPGPQKR